MVFWRRIVGGTTLIIYGVWFGASFNFINLAPSARSKIWAAFMMLLGVGIVMDWRSRKDQPVKEPSPAQSARNVILLTGLAAVAMTARGAQSRLGYIVPASIAIVTVALAFAAFCFASKNKQKIGEAQFYTTSAD